MNSTATELKGHKWVGRLHAERVPKEYPDNSIYKVDQKQQDKSEIKDIFRSVEFSNQSSLDEQNRYVHQQFRSLMNELFEKYKPTTHPFFENLKNAPTSVVRNPEFLSELYKRYNAAMHATRASVWFTPYLNTPRLRQRKAAIIVDDDTVDGELTHHKQCENLFVWLGAKSVLPEDSFGDLEELKKHLDPSTYDWCEKTWKLYTKSTGAWSIFEVLSDNWQSGLAYSLLPHYDNELLKQQYFDEIATGHIEILHMLETVSLTEDVLHRYPHLYQETAEDAIEMAKVSYSLWDNFDSLLASYMTN